MESNAWREDSIDTLRSKTLEHLTALVGFDTQNPPRDVDEGGLFGYLREQLDGFELELVDLGDGCLSLHARRGEPTVLFNFHVDTVPASEAWETDPFTLEIDDERAVGLGACDIKGASACMLAALCETDADVSLLFTSDEEAGSSRCVRDFVNRDQSGYETVVVAEPTGAEAVLEHRGIITCNAVFRGIPGHASAPRALEDNAVHRLMRWGRRALRFAEEHEATTYGPLSGIRLNIGRIEGGIKPNVIAPSAKVRFGCRPLPHQDAHILLEQIQQLSATDAVRWEEGFYGPTLPAEAGEDDVAAPARAWAEAADLPIGSPVDFWTEASLFSEAGYTSLVFGPGDIAQAHTAGEWVALEQLDRVARTYVSLLESGITTA